MVGYKLSEPYFNDQKISATSDAGDLKGTINIGVDSWVGYFPLCSKEFKRRMRGSGYLIRCHDDKANYQERFQNLKSGKLEFAVATVDSYLKSGGTANFPGTIVTVIDQSKGGDGIVARKSRIKSLDELKSATGVKIAYTPASPSEFLLRATQSHFDIKNLSKDQAIHQHIETDGAEAAFDHYKKGHVEIAVLWEPYFTQAKRLADTTTLLSSRDTKNLIVDVLLVSRSFASKQPTLVRNFLSQYYRTLKTFRDEPAKLRHSLETEANIEKRHIPAMLEGVEWYSLFENAMNWFGVEQTGKISREEIIDVIDSSLEILTTTKGLASNPLPQENPYAILNRSFVETLYTQGTTSQRQAGSHRDKVAFEQLSDEAWDKLVEVGTLKVRPITFQSGTGVLDDRGQDELKKAAKNLAHYPNFRVVVRGHTGISGDSAANRQLSQIRAQAVKNYLTSSLNIVAPRIRAEGFGAEQPLPRLPGESDRAYKYRLPRVELYLVSEAL